MKKVLLGTSAIALAGAFAAPASAAEWQVRVGGYMEQFAAYADNDVDVFDPTFSDEETPAFTGFAERGGDFDGIDSKQDAEIHFLPKITLDNGIEIGADIQLEGNTSGDQIDESFMRIKGAFGEVLLGSENSAGYKMTYAAPDVTFVNVNSGSLTAFVPFSGDGVMDDFFRGTGGTTFIENQRNNDAQRFTYFTPRFAGLQVGASYARDGNQDSNAQVDEDTELSDIVDIGANYVNSFGALSMAISGRWGTADAPKGEGSDPDIWSVGGNLGYNLGAGTITVGGSYAEQNDAGSFNGEAWDAGIAYETGPWGFSFTWFHGENKANECFSDVISCSGDREDENDQLLLGISYALAKGVSLSAYGAYVDFESPTFSGVVGEDEEVSAENEVESWVVGTGIKISF